MQNLEELIKELSPDLKEEVRDFVESLVKTSTRKKNRTLKMTWAGGLREYRDKFTSLELQKKALEWWGD